jgi:mRNA interferase RelE/StbE
MAYRVDWDPRAWREFSDLPKTVQTRVQPAVEALSRDPRPSGSRKLRGLDRAYRIRVGAHRVVYEIHDDVLLVLVVAVAHRSRVYRRGT